MASSRERSGGGGDGRLVPFGVDESRRVGWGCLWVGLGGGVEGDELLSIDCGER